MNVYQIVLLGEILFAVLVSMIITRTEWKNMESESKRSSKLYYRIKSSQNQCNDIDEDVAFERMTVINTDILTPDR